MAQINLSKEKQLMDLGEQTCCSKGEGEGEGVGWTENLGLTDANYCLWSG